MSLTFTHGQANHALSDLIPLTGLSYHKIQSKHSRHPLQSFISLRRWFLIAFFNGIDKIRVPVL
jgi:hypothetical protein